MRIDTLEDLYIEQLKDIYNASQQSRGVTKDMAKAATDQDLADALNAGVERIELGMAALQKLADGHEERIEGAFCKGMEGLVSEARAQALNATIGKSATKDAMIITQYQRLVHHAIAGYGCLAAFADQLELGQDLIALNDCLATSYDGDRTMVRLATGGINKDAHT